MFIDTAEIYVKGGDGGNGCIAFRREKFVREGRPLRRRRRPRRLGLGRRGPRAQHALPPAPPELLPGGPGRARHGLQPPRQGGRRTSRFGSRSARSSPMPRAASSIADLVTRRASGFFSSRAATAAGATSTSRRRRVRRRASRSRAWPGEERRLAIELKLLADVAIIGFPNAGKSTLISAISAAKPKIADYPFTTLVPHLGVVTSHDGRARSSWRTSPASSRARTAAPGLGIRFLKHVERCRLLCHLVDASAAGDAEADVATIESGARGVLARGRRSGRASSSLPSATRSRIRSGWPRSGAAAERRGPAVLRDLGRDARRPAGARAAPASTRSPTAPDVRAEAAVDSEDLGLRPMRIGVFGGTFDPGAQRPRPAGRGRGDEVPAAPRLLRAGAALPAQGRRRRPMRATASPCWRSPSQGRPDWSIDLEELDREPPSYTVDTLRAIQARHPGDELWLLMGTDILAGFARWRRPEEILKIARIAAFHREPFVGTGSRCRRSPASRDRLTVFDAGSVKISATDLRNDLAAGKGLAGPGSGAGRGVHYEARSLQAGDAAELKPGFSAQDKVREGLTAALDRKASAVLVFNLTELTTMADYFVLSTARHRPPGPRHRRRHRREARPGASRSRA